MREIAIGGAVGIVTGAVVGATGSVFLGALLCGAAGLVAGLGYWDARRETVKARAERDAAAIGIIRSGVTDWSELVAYDTPALPFKRLGPGWDGQA